MMGKIAIGARHYMMLYGDDAFARIDADLSRAIGQKDRDRYLMLTQVKLRMKRLQLHAQAKSRLNRFMRMTGLIPRQDTSIGSTSKIPPYG